MATAWSQIQIAAGGGGFNEGTSYSQTVSKPTAGHLMIVTGVVVSATAVTSMTITDNGSNTGWNQIGSRYTNGESEIFSVWWRLATSTDAANLTTATVAFTGTPGSFPSTGGQFEEYSAGTNTIVGLDLSVLGTATGVESGTFTYNVSPSTGSGQPSNTDELVWIQMGGIAATSNTLSFTGTSALTVLTNNTLGAGGTIGTGYGGLNQASATAGSNVFRQVGVGAGNTVYQNLCVSFYYTSSGATPNSGFLEVIARMVAFPKVPWHNRKSGLSIPGFSNKKLVLANA
jgi:hypothetical protein